MNIIEEKNNNLLHRQELVLTIEGDSAPSNSEIIKKLSEQIKKPEENIIIEKISSGFGNKTFTIKANIYKDSESKNKYVTISKKQRKKLAEAEKKAKEEVKVEEKVEEKPAVNTNEETPTESEKPVGSSDVEVSKEAEVKKNE